MNQGAVCRPLIDRAFGDFQNGRSSSSSILMESICVDCRCCRIRSDPRDFRTEQDVRDWAAMLARYSDRGGRRLGPNS
jgi:hypothetical protein